MQTITTIDNIDRDAVRAAEQAAESARHGRLRARPVTREDLWLTAVPPFNRGRDLEQTKLTDY